MRPCYTRYTVRVCLDPIRIFPMRDVRPRPAHSFAQGQFIQSAPVDLDQGDGGLSSRYRENHKPRAQVSILSASLFNNRIQ